MVRKICFPCFCANLVELLPLRTGGATGSRRGLVIIASIRRWRSSGACCCSVRAGRAGVHMRMTGARGRAGQQ
eukprot:10935005-Alexandrium_andersonii.AAC.1